MAVILGICDRDPARREAVVRSMPGSFSGLPYLVQKRLSVANVDFYWEASSSTPVSYATGDANSSSRFAWVMGDFDASYSPTSDAAGRLLQRTSAEPRDLSGISGQNGYYLGVLIEPDGQMTLGTDALGLFPLYYWAKRDVFLFGTSPDLFRLHPAFVAEPDYFGIASVLLLSHITSGHSLISGVHRSSPGFYVNWTADRQPKEIEANPIQLSDTHFGTPYEDVRGMVLDCLDAFHEPLAGLPNLNILLSGGLDSRAIAASLARAMPSGDSICAVTLGNSRDSELSYARKVSRVLGWRHLFRDVDFESYPANAIRQVALESLQGPFASFQIGTAVSLLEKSSGPVLSGYFGDAVIGDRHIQGALSSQSGEFRSGTMISMLRRYGFPNNDVIDLLAGREGYRLISEVISNLESQWNSIDGLPFQKAWMFSLVNRQRFHIGSIIWRLSMGAWPILPYSNRRLLEFCASMPLSYFRNRKIQSDNIRQMFPGLAQLPLDRNDWLPGYLVKSWQRKALDRIPGLWRLEQSIPRKKERRYYYRIYDFNGTGWQLVRREAEKYRPVSGSLLNSKAVNRLLPVAEANVFFEDGIVEASKTKTLAGLLLWNGMRFASNTEN